MASVEDRERRYSGFVIARLSKPVPTGSDLRGVARRSGFDGLLELLQRDRRIRTSRVVFSIPPRTVLRLEREAEESEFPPLHSLTSYWRLDPRQSSSDPSELVKSLEALKGEVDLAYRELVVELPGVIAYGDDPLSAQQGYREAAPLGVDALHAWTRSPPLAGATVTFVDVEEDWLTDHEDVPATTLVAGSLPGWTASKRHGVAVLGIVAAVDNSLGVVGIACRTTVRLASHHDGATALHVADAIATAVPGLAPGDVMLLEVHRSDLPTESDPADLAAIRLAAARGIVVVECAGNANSLLDTWVGPGAALVFDRTAASFVDTGSIMVGSSKSAVALGGHERLDSAVGSNYGSRLDCYGWGENVVTAGGTTGGAEQSRYTTLFGGTSAAGAIVAGVALVVQQAYKAAAGTPLSATQMRAVLADPLNGTPQTGDVSKRIGVMPDLNKILNRMSLVPDVFARDFVGDTGVVPSSGALSLSPDIIVRPTQQPASDFGPGPTENDDTLGGQVEAGQPNFVYVRMKNRSSSAASPGAVATVYWSRVSTLVDSGSWNLIGTTAPAVTVPLGGGLTVAGPLQWSSIPPSLPPPPYHYCFVAVVGSPTDPAPPLPGPTDWAGFIDFVKNNNNVTWRNFNVVDLLLPNVLAPFLVSGARDRARSFDLEIQSELPDAIEVWWELPRTLHAELPRGAFRKTADVSERRVAVLLPHVRTIPLPHVRLARGAAHRCAFRIRGRKGLEYGLHRIAVRQLYEGLEVGRVTWGIRVRKPSKG